MFSTRHLLATALTCTAALALTGQANAQYTSGQVNVSGATLFYDFFTYAASTNDYIDVDGDGLAGSLGTFPPPQLAAEYGTAAFSSTFYTFNYRGVGSGNGLAEMRNYQLARLDGRSGGLPTSLAAEGGIINQVAYVDQTGAIVPGVGNASNPGGSPVVQTSIDIGVMDVPTSWFVANPTATAASWSARPGDASYGTNSLKTTTGQGNTLKSLNDGITATPLNTNTASPDDHTVYDTTIAWVPIGFIANPGTGLEDVKMTELQHLFVTGRMPTGENLQASSRDSGSGTRNGAMNSIGVDPSFGRGDNQSAKTDSDVNDILGPDYTTDALGGSSRMEGTVQNGRLAVGYTGLLGGSRAIADMEGGKYELLNVMKDIDGDGDGNPDGNTYVRPSAANIINNADVNDGWQVGGSETFATVGDPNASRDPSDPLYTTNPKMANETAASYINNIVDSIANFVSLPGDPNNQGSPGELLVSNYTLTAAIERIAVDGIDFSQTNPVYNANVNSASLSALSSTLGSVDATGSVGAGRVPTRTSGITYTDGNVNDEYLDVDGNAVAYGASGLSARNHIAGDFNNDGARSTADVAQMMAWANYRGLGASPSSVAKPESGTGLVVEIIGDFNGDGNFNEDDVRYFADGLYIDGGKLNRGAAFEAVDTAYGANFFGTTLANGTYDAGDSAADIAGSADGPSMGGKPTGSDGIVDALDIDYVYANFGDFSILDQAVYMDLSADMNGDLVVGQSDVDWVVETVLETAYGDANLDGVVDTLDSDIVSTNFGLAGLGWAGGDFNGDGVTDALDQAFISIPGDLNGDGFVGLDDLDIILTAWNQTVTAGDPSDPSGDGFVGLDDLDIVLNNWNNGTPAAAASNTPEPASLALLGLGGVAIIKRR